jgi:hypothetical protein
MLPRVAPLNCRLPTALIMLKWEAWPATYYGRSTRLSYRKTFRRASHPQWPQQGLKQPHMLSRCAHAAAPSTLRGACCSSHTCLPRCSSLRQAQLCVVTYACMSVMAPTHACLSHHKLQIPSYVAVSVASALLDIGIAELQSVAYKESSCKLCAPMKFRHKHADIVKCDLCHLSLAPA